MALAVVEPADPSEAPAPDFDELVERGPQVASQTSRLDAELVGIVREIDRNGSEHLDMTTRQFVAWQFGLTPAEAGRVCRLASQLESLPLLSAELREGRLSAGTVATLASVATPENEAALIETATVATGAQLQTLVRAYQHTPALGAQVEAAIRVEKEAELADRRDAPADRDDTDGPLSRDPEVSNAAALVRMAQSVLAGKVRRDGILPERFQLLIHLDDRRLERDDGGKLWFTAPNGHIMAPARRPKAPSGPPPKPGQRHRDTYEPLTGFASSVILDTWPN